MINGRMWLVVKPTVGVPLIIGGVALASLAIHTAVLLNTTWYPAFYQGGTRIRPAAVQTNGPALAAVQFTAPLAKAVQ